MRRNNVRFSGSVAQLELTREHLETLTSELLERTMEITQRTIDTAEQKGVTDFDDVLLVGGMSLMPIIAQTLKERFGCRAASRSAPGGGQGGRDVRPHAKGEGEYAGEEIDANRGVCRKWPTSFG